MDLLLATVNQMIFLFAFIVLGYVLTKSKYLPSSAASILSKLENMIFIPALVMGTFIKNFTIEKFSSYWKIILFSLILELALLPICILICKACAKDTYTRKIYTYGLCFSNFGFMGNAVVSAIFPQYFAEYIVFTIPLWGIIYLWGVPVLLTNRDANASKGAFLRWIKPFINPMFICMILGMIIGITGVSAYVPSSILSVIDVSGSCMSPIAMLLTGITLGSISLNGTLKRKSIYAVTGIRLAVFPLIALGAFALIPASEVIVICTVCSLAMPLGLNTVVIPSAYGKDTSTAAGMALVSHLLSIVSIPLIFILLRLIMA